MEYSFLNGKGVSIKFLTSELRDLSRRGSDKRRNPEGMEDAKKTRLSKSTVHWNYRDQGCIQTVLTGLHQWCLRAEKSGHMIPSPN